MDTSVTESKKITVATKEVVKSGNSGQMTNSASKTLSKKVSGSLNAVVDPKNFKVF